MTRDQLRDRALSCLPTDRARFGPLVLFILGAIFAEVIAYYTEKALDKCSHKSIRNPSLWARWQLRRQVRAAWSSPGFTAAMRDAQAKYPPWAAELQRLDFTRLDRQHGDEVQAALLAMVGTLSDNEIATALSRPA